MTTSPLENLCAAPIFHPANYSPCAKKAVITTLALSIIVTITGVLGLLAATNALPLGSFGVIGVPGAISLTAFGVLASILTLIVTVKALYSQREESPLSPSQDSAKFGESESRPLEKDQHLPTHDSLVEPHQVNKINFTGRQDLARKFFPFEEGKSPPKKSIEAWKTLSGEQLRQICALGDDCSVYIWLLYQPHLEDNQKEELRSGKVPNSKEEFEKEFPKAALNEEHKSSFAQFSGEEVTEMLQAGYLSPPHFALITSIQLISCGL